MNLETPRTTLRALRGFLTIPGTISLAGIVLVVVVQKTEVWLDQTSIIDVPEFLKITSANARSVLSVLAGAAMSGLVMVYSIVLLVYTMAASAIGPRLLQRFSDDRVNQIAVGSLGATFLYCTFGLWFVREEAPAHLTLAIALSCATASVLLLLFFVHRVSQRVTIDHEAAEIARALDDQVDIAIRSSGRISAQDVVLPASTDHAVYADGVGYVDAINVSGLVEAARAEGVVVVYSVQPGDFVIEGALLATVFGVLDSAFEEKVRAGAPLLVARDPDGDLRFSTHLLIEIALRALSPGVNDTFTAIACADRLSSSLTRARHRGLRTGVYDDKDGAVRVVVPTIDTDTLFNEAFPPLRRAANGNGLMLNALVTALRRMGLAARPDDRDAIRTETELLLAETRQCSFLEEDRAAIITRIEAVLVEIGESKNT